MARRAIVVRGPLAGWDVVQNGEVKLASRERKYCEIFAIGLNVGSKKEEHQ
jgi:hypothetical protein